MQLATLSKILGTKFYDDGNERNTVLISIRFIESLSSFNDNEARPIPINFKFGEFKNKNNFVVLICLILSK